jgi:hypothetical protein
MLISQSRFSALIFNILLKSLKKSFYSAKFMLKGLDAWSDRLLGLQTDLQMAGERELKRQSFSKVRSIVALYRKLTVEHL